jgi:hypothetical protein
LRHIAESLHAGNCIFRTHIQFFQGFPYGINDSIPRRFSPAERTTHANRLAGNQAGHLGPMNRFILIQHPQHMLGAGHNIRGRHIDKRTDIMRQLTHPAATNLFLLAGA